MKTIITLLTATILTGCSATQQKLTVFESRCPNKSTSSHQSEIDPSELLLARAAPVYPRKALQKGIEGFVDFEVDIDEKGVPVNIGVIRSFPDQLFIKAATNAVKQYRYKTKQEVDLVFPRQCVNITLNFRLSG